MGSVFCNSSSAQHSTTFLHSLAFVIILAQSLSTLANFLASRGSCFAISPPVNTDSRAHHSICTFIQLSRVSDVSESEPRSSWAIIRKGATCLIVRTVWRFIWASSSSSTTNGVALSVCTPRSFHSENKNSFVRHWFLISPIWCSILSCLSAPSVTSSISSLTDTKLASSKDCSLNSGLPTTSKVVLQIFITSSQCLALIESLDSSARRGKMVWKSSISFRSCVNDSYSRNLPGNFLNRPA